MKPAMNYAWKRSKIRFREMVFIFITSAALSTLSYVGLNLYDSFLMFWFLLGFTFWGGILTIAWLAMFLERFIKHFYRYKKMHKNV